MGHIIADEGMLLRLKGIIEPVEIHDAEGRLLGTFTPHVPPEVLARYAKAKELFALDIEAVERSAATKGEGIPTAEVLRRLRALETNR